MVAGASAAASRRRLRSHVEPHQINAGIDQLTAEMTPFTTWDEANARIVANVPREVRQVCEWAELFTEVLTWIELRPVIYTWWA